MLRSRDLFVFVVIVFVLCLGILITYVYDSNLALFKGTPVVLDVHTTASTTFTATAPENKRDRTSAIARLREAIGQSGEVISQSPSVETIETMHDDSDTADAGTKIQHCTTADDSLTIARSWPLTGTSIMVQNGVRSVVYQHQEIQMPTVTASGTASTSIPTVPKIITTPLLIMSLYPPMQGDTACVPSEIIGVTSSGGLMSNSDAQRYTDKNQNELLGYARDGFPIYGLYEGKTDDCGGYIHPEGYRYTISKERDFILGCFVGVPQAFGTI